MFPFIRIALFTFQSRGLIFLLAFWIALTIFEYSAHRLGINREEVSSLSFIAFLIFIVAARLGYVVQYLPIYFNSPEAVLALDLNTLSWPVGLSISAAATFWRIRHHHLPPLLLLDALTMGLPVITAGLALADLATGDGYGAPAQLPWSIPLWGTLRHPVQTYDLIASLCIGLILWRVKWLPNGQRFGVFTALYAATRLFLEAFHGESAVTWSGIRIVQLWSLIFLVAALLMIRYFSQHNTTSSYVQKLRVN